MKKYLAILMSVLLLAAVLTGCAATAKSDSVAMESAPMAPSAGAMDMPMEMPEMEEAAAEESYKDYSTNLSTTVTEDGGSMEVETVQNFSDKIIYSGHVYMETTEFDNTIAELDRAVQAFGGFVQDSSVNGDSRSNEDGTTSVVNRWGYYTVRVPADKFDAFMKLAGELGNVTSSSRSAENVTSQYTDYEARLSSLTTQEERLLDMLAKSGDLESLIQLEARLSEVRYEIESIERNLRNLDQRLAYSTVNLELHEVEIYTPNVAVQRTYGQRLSDAFADGWNGFVRGLQRFTINVAESLPGLVLFAVIVAAAVIVLRRTCKKHKARRAAKKAAEQTEE
jgi:chemotaxis protein histidine kinase CheA